MKSAAGRCPHLGGVALRTLTVQANHAGATTESLHKALHAARIRSSELADQIQKLRAELARVKIELKLESSLEDKIQFIVFNNLTDLKQSNIGLMTNEDYNIGGIFVPGVTQKSQAS